MSTGVIKVGNCHVLDKYDLRKEIGRAARRIEAASSATAFNDDPHVIALIYRWRRLSRVAARALDQLERAIETRRTAATAEDRKFIQKVRSENPDLLMIGEGEDEPLPLLCMVTGLAVMANDRVFGNPETGYVVLKQALRVMRAI